MIVTLQALPQQLARTLMVFVEKLKLCSNFNLLFG